MRAQFDIHGLMDYWRERIEKDLTPFVDPGTALSIDVSGRQIEARWEQRQRVREAVFMCSIEDGVAVQYGGSRLPYRSFFASADMADLLGLSKIIARGRKQGLFVETRAKRFDPEETATGPATEILCDAMQDSVGRDATLVVMVTGEAGAGKTSVLQHLVWTRADAYLRGQADSLFLYINAQGRALARFNEALATELNDLRANVTYHAISALVRMGLVIPVIDGFDELLGVGGYDDAFSSLASFIEELDGAGRIVASARSTYYEQEFVARANRVSSLGAQVWRQIPVEVLAWGEEEFNDFLHKRAAQLDPALDRERFEGRVAAAFRGENSDLKTKPLFVVRAADLIARGVQLTGESYLLDELVGAYLERERTEKLLDRSGDSLLTCDQLKELLITLAEEMWNQQTRELDHQSVREVAEYVLSTSSVSDAPYRVVVERMTTLAFLATGERTGTVTFEHETFFSYFLAHRFVDALRRGDAALSGLLGRSVLPDDVAKTGARILFRVSPPPDIRQVIRNLGSAGVGRVGRAVQIRENAGSFARVLLCRHCKEFGPIDGLELRNLVLPGGDLDGVLLSQATIDEVEFRRVNLSNTKITKSKSRGLLLHEVLVSESETRLELAGLNVSSEVIGLRVLKDDAVRTVFEPTELRQILSAIGALQSSDRGVQRVRRIHSSVFSLVEKLVRAYNRSNPVCTSDDFLQSVFHDQNWEEVQRLLVASGVVSEERRATSGMPKLFLRRQVLPAEIMAGVQIDADVPESVAYFWQELERTFPG